MPKKGIIIGYIIFAVLVIILYFSWHKISFPNQSTIQNQIGNIKIEIKKGEGIKDIANKLENAGLIKNKKLFQFYIILKNLRKRFWPGEYYLSKNMSLSQIVKILTTQHLAPEKNITIIEGWTNDEIANYLDKEGVIKKEVFLSDLQNLKDELINEYNFLKTLPPNATLQGFLFPDTYRIYKKSTTKKIVRKLLDNFEAKITPQMYIDMKKKGKNIFEVVTLASLVEKEASNEVDRRLIADIFWRRLAANIPLQSCATINYILGKPKRHLTFEDTRTPSPYNTYINRGLPPGPINNPSLSAIKAVIYPLPNDYWYFLATPDGRTVFSRTKTEHDAAKQKYLK
ncbi:endolytic transglycosylase MltG [bacterium]|nr:endolytic transglycosylase MltG [bacterium]